jgi:hypothetical protein
MEYVIDKIFPTNKLHMISGPSGAGKTTFIFNMIRDWSIGADVLGHKSNPSKYLYIALDRDTDEIDNRIEAAGLDPAMIPHLSILEAGLTMKKLLDRVPLDTRVLFIDGFAVLTPMGKHSDYSIVADFLRLTGAILKQRQLTIFGTPHATKTKQGEEFTHARHKVLGSVAWGAFSSSLLFIDSEDSRDVNCNTRIVEVLPRCAAPERHRFSLNELGGFVYEGRTDQPTTDQAETNILFGMPINKPTTLASIVKNGAKMGVNQAKLIELLAKWSEAGLVIPEGDKWVRTPSATA